MASPSSGPPLPLFHPPPKTAFFRSTNLSSALSQAVAGTNKARQPVRFALTIIDLGSAGPISGVNAWY